MKKLINLEVTFDHRNIKHSCHACGGIMQQNIPYARCLDKIIGMPEYGELRVCRNCLSSSHIDARIDRHAAQLEKQAATVRNMKGRINVPDLWNRMEASGYFATEIEAEHVADAEAVEAKNGNVVGAEIYKIY